MVQSTSLTRPPYPLLFLLALLAGLGFGAGMLRPTLAIGESSTEEPSIAAPIQQPLVLPREVLLLGVDQSGRLTDVIASLNLSEEGLHLTQIPRDTFVRSSEHGEQKINALYYYGGVEAVSRQVSDLVGRQLEHHIVVNLKALRQLADALGGLEMEVNKPLRYRDRSQGLSINIPAGTQRLNGEQLEGFLRFRHDEEGDLGRMRRQKQAVEALRSQLSDPTVVLRLPQLLAVASEHLDTNLNPLQLAGLAHQLAKQPLSSSQLQGHLGYRNGISYWFFGDPDQQS